MKTATEFFEDKWLTASFGERTKAYMVSMLEEYAIEYHRSQSPLNSKPKEKEPDTIPNSKDMVIYDIYAIAGACESFYHGQTSEYQARIIARIKRYAVGCIKYLQSNEPQKEPEPKKVFQVIAKLERHTANYSVVDEDEKHYRIVDSEYYTDFLVEKRLCTIQSKDVHDTNVVYIPQDADNQSNEPGYQGPGHTSEAIQKLREIGTQSQEPANSLANQIKTKEQGEQFMKALESISPIAEAKWPDDTESQRAFINWFKKLGIKKINELKPIWIWKKSQEWIKSYINK